MCVLIFNHHVRDCNTCGTFKCVANSSGSSSGKSATSGGTSKGALAGAVVGALIALAAAICLVLWYRRRRALKAAAIPEAKADIPAPAEAVLNRPDPSEKLTSRPPTEVVNTRVYSTQSDGTIDLDPESQRSASRRVQSQRTSTQSNPFTDGHSSIQTTGTTGTEGVNVIPIAFVPPGSVSSIVSASSIGASENHPLTPVRPARSPELNLGMNNVNVSRDGAPIPYAQSQISGISGVSSRNSYISNMSYASEFLNEAPVIVTPTQGGVVRQVIGSVKAEMISASGSSGPSTPTSANSLGPSLASRPSIRSPLAASSFGPSDVLREHEEEPELPARSPFDDEHSLREAQYTPSSVNTSGTPSPNFSSSPLNSASSPELQEPARPWAQASESSRPSSLSTQAGSIVADIGSATRVNVGLGGLQSGSTLPDTPSTGYNQRSPYRTTMGRLVNPPSTENLGTLEQQQQRALDHAQAQAQAQGGERSRRVSGSSAISNTADSILESFPFVPPSPISDRPIRSPPRSPLNQPAFNATTAPTAPTPPPLRPPAPPEPLNPPKNRGTLGMSTGSQLSTASSGLGSFPFHIDSGHARDGHGGAPPSSFHGRQRASLDTLALTSDLSSYPLGYDRAEPRDSYSTG
jgi:protein OPY2